MNTVEKIKKLKEEKKAIILAHYYVDEEVQKIADYIGDSFYLAKVASQTDADRIVFAGVEFMGESAKILNPEKKVFMPDAFADCPMAHMITIKEIKEMKEKYEDLAVVKNVLATYAEAEDLVNIGAYKAGSNPSIDYALSKIDAVNEFLQQDVYEKLSFEESILRLEELFPEEDA